MAYRQGNFDFVIDSNFRPFSYQEMLAPLALYKEEYEKVENAYDDLSAKAGDFKYLAEQTNNNPKAKAIYEGYVNDLAEQADDLARNGLNIANRRALMNMKRRYQGEIGQLEKANAALQEERRLRRNNKDTSMLYAVDNLSLDDYLDNNTPNLYSVSGDELYKRGAQAAQSASSRIYDNTKVKNLTKYYQEIIQKMGYNPELMYQFREDMSAIPELRDAVDSILKEKGVDDNLTGNNYDRARESVINGIIDGAIYKEARNTQRDYSHLTAAEAASNARAIENQKLNAAMHGMIPDGKGGYTYDFRSDPSNADRLWMYEFDEDGNLKGINPEYMKNYQFNPATNRMEKRPKESTTTDAIYKLTGKKDLLNEGNGFSYMEGNTRHKFNYIGGISSHSSGKSWQSGNIGEDIPGHAFNWTSTNLSTSGGLDFWNVGDYTAKHMGDNSRVLTDTEQDKLMYDFGPNGEAAVQTAFGKEVEKYLTNYAKEHNLDLQEVANRAVLVEVPSKRGRNDYLVAIEE